jgi:hypothetical protein
MKRVLVALGMISAVLASSVRNPPLAEARYTECKVGGVAEWTTAPRENISVWCPGGTSNMRAIEYIVVPAGASYAARFLSIALAAFLSGKTFYADIPEAAEPGQPCAADNCRIASQFGVKD